ncbi:high choriolytic enzyme 1-like [Dermacentor andersoni]|uniref:high choriolytic enzyme 1-like n=1 Tax=Dermacentor andersoni TaxID=34620 RepID=UPI002155BDE9|nr:astacin-like metalloprotease toxin 4 [Dermacentor andersoni]
MKGMIFIEAINTVERGDTPPPTPASGTDPNATIIRNVMNEIEKRTCVRFVKRTDQKDYVHLVSRQGCYSYLGRNGGEQPLSLGRGCLFNGSVTHELLHAVGFFHEHSRPDRDDYIDVFPENIIEAFLPNFKKIAPRHIRLLTAFDFDSVMLYGSDSFSRGNGLPSMLAKNGDRLIAVYKKDGLSSQDVIRINTLYNCTQG